MSNLMTSFNAGVSGLASAQSALNTTAHNLANATTTGYSRQQVIVTDSFYQNSVGWYDNIEQVGTGTNIALTRQVRNTFLDGQYRLQLGRQNFYEANANAAKEIEDMLGELQGEEFQTNLTNLWSALSSLSTKADDVVSKEELVSVTSQFLESAKVLQQELNDYQTNLNLEVQKQVDSINDIVGQIKDLNKLIQRYEATGNTANDYRDQRNTLLDKLSGYINIDVNEEIDSTITIYSNGGYLLDQANQYLLKTEYESETSKLLKPVWAGGGDYFYSGTLETSAESNTDIGSLRGLITARGPYAATYKDVEGISVEDYNKTIGASVIMTVQSQFDTMVHGIVKNVNDVLCPNKELTLADGTTITVLDEEKALHGDDENQTVGMELFSRRNQERYTRTTVSVLDEFGNPTDIEVYKYNEEDSTDPYSLYTINQLVVNSELQKDASKLPTMYNNVDGKLGGYAYNELGSIANSFEENVGAIKPGSLTVYNVFEFYNGMVSELGTQANIWNSIIDNQETTVVTLEEQRQNVMGVSSDEELSDLIKFQQCYNASSRYINTVAEMLEYLIEKLGG